MINIFWIIILIVLLKIQTNQFICKLIIFLIYAMYKINYNQSGGVKIIFYPSY